MKKYWFKRRRYGYGWTPTSWQGWTLIGIWLVFVVAGAFLIDEDSIETVWVYLALVFLSVIPLILISYIKGPEPKWRWGKSADDDPEKDI